VEVERQGRDEPAKFVDAKINEFSLTPFPAGYDNGGLTPAFNEFVGREEPDEEEDNEPEYSAQSLLKTRPHNLITNHD
jgi:hypothetical protein